MSIKVSHYVWEQANAEGTPLLLLLALADQANDEGICYPGKSSLQRRIRKSESVVRKAAAALEDAGELRRVQNAGTATASGNTNLYILTGYRRAVELPELPESVAVMCRRGGENYVRLVKIEGDGKADSPTHSEEGRQDRLPMGRQDRLPMGRQDRLPKPSVKPSGKPIPSDEGVGAAGKPTRDERNAWWDALVYATGLSASDKRIARLIPMMAGERFGKMSGKYAEFALDEPLESPDALREYGAWVRTQLRDATLPSAPETLQGWLMRFLDERTSKKRIENMARERVPTNHPTPQQVWIDTVAPTVPSHPDGSVDYPFEDGVRWHPDRGLYQLEEE